VFWCCGEGGACWVVEHSDGDRAGCNFFPLASDVKAYIGLSQRATLVAWNGSTA
jgi:hypothetical protein